VKNEFKLPSKVEFDSFKNMPKIKREGLSREMLNLFDKDNEMKNPGFNAKRYAGTVINAKSSGVSAAVSIHSGVRSGFDCSGVRSPTMSHLSMTSSTMNKEAKAIFHERLY
jgi:hypothetical protein